MRTLLFFILLFPLLLRANIDSLFSENEDLALNHHVNVITGNLNLHFQDAEVQGASPFTITRTYSSEGALEKEDNIFRCDCAKNCYLLQGGWMILPHMYIRFVHNEKIETSAFYIPEKNGAVIKYVFECKQAAKPDKKSMYVFKPEIDANQYSGLLSGRNNPRNNRLRYFPYEDKVMLLVPDGSSRHYEVSEKFLTLKKEITPHQHQILYNHNHRRYTLGIAVQNPAGTKTFSHAHFTMLRPNKRFHFNVITSDNQTLNYRSIYFKDKDYLNDVQSSSRPPESDHFIPGGRGARLHNFILGGVHQFRVHYYEPPGEKEAIQWKKHPERKDFSCDKVKVLEGPMGKNGEFLPIATFFYAPGHTDVRDIDNLLIRYHHDSHKLTEIHYFDQADQLNSLVRFIWDGPWLKGKAFMKNATEALFSKTFQYDASGNVTEEILWGNLTGQAAASFTIEPNGSLKGAETYHKRFSYLPHFNVPMVEEEEGGLTYKYFYKPHTDRLSAQFICDKDKILIRQFFFYNDDNLLVQEIKDDGISENPNDLTKVTERHIKYYTLDYGSGLVIALDECCLDVFLKREKKLKRTEFTHGSQKRVITEHVFDAQSQSRYTLYTQYDAQGRVISKTTPTGQCNTYRYDCHGKLLESKEVGSTKKVYSYHPSGTAFSRQEIGFDGQMRTTYTQYDGKGRLLSQTDEKGNTTLQTYDCFGRCLSTAFPLVKNENEDLYHPTIQFAYDVQNNLTQTVSPRGEVTHTLYNTLKKPIQVTYADGTVIRHVYNKNGTLAHTLYPDRTEVHYTYDLFQRMTSKRNYSSNKHLLSEEFWEYSAFHLISHTDEKGLTTFYTYDGSGKKLAESCECKTQYFSYDALGFLERITDGNVTHYFVNDVAGKVLEQWKEDRSGKIEDRMVFTYDGENRKANAQRFTSLGMAEDNFTYDFQGRLCRHENPLGEVTQFLFNDQHINDLGQKVMQKITIDPLGHQKIETFDALDRLCALEKRDCKNLSVALEEIFHDSLGNCAKKVTTIFETNTPIKKITTQWQYDSHGHVLKEIESGQKITTYSYDVRGRLLEKTLPSGIILYYSYDDLGRMIQMLSSDYTIHYYYSYERGYEPTAILDQIQHFQWQRTYNLFGQVLKEKGPFGLNYQWKYDDYGRCSQFTLPDNSSIAYHYFGNHLQTVQRRAFGNILYEHQYTKFDPNGHVEEEECILGLGTTKTQHDFLERPAFQSNPYLSHQVKYGPSGLVTSTLNSLLGRKCYEYDALDQLIREEKQHYFLNSLGNPIHAVVNDCNQLLSTKDINLTYDLDGNPIQRVSAQDDVIYNYDALGRLLRIKGTEKEIVYTYDPFSRLLSKEVTTTNGKTKCLYLHNKETELGTITHSGVILQLKVLGLGIKGDVGAAIALELNGEVFAPLHDFGGNIIAIVSASGQITEKYPTDAFGKETLDFSPTNPWRFSSKRNEEGFVYFSKRFYDPSLGRWLTPDPAGFTEGPNLYLYVLNNPLNRLDLFGLHSDPIFPWTTEPGESNINIPIYEFQNAPEAKNIIVCKGNIDGVDVDWVVSCGHWHKLQYSQEELDVGIVNIMDHFHDLMPKEGAMIGLITSQNGINTSLPEFRKMSQSIVDKVPEGPLYIGLYNPCSSLVGDVIRVYQEKQGKETPTVARTRQFLESMVEDLHSINPRLLHMHMAHSEAGLIENLAISKMTPDKKDLLKQHLVSVSFGAAQPLPKSAAFKAINIYSDKDYITKRFATPFLNDPNYDIKIVDCISKASEKSLWIADHAFKGATYQNALQDQVGNMREKYGFYNEQNR